MAKGKDQALLEVLIPAELLFSPVPVQVNPVFKSPVFINTCFKWWGKALNAGLGSRNSRLLILVLTLTFVTFGSSFCHSASVPRFLFKKEST